MTNRTRSIIAAPGRNFWRIATLTALLISPAAHATYWNVFNIEGESSQSAQFVTYDSGADMLVDENRTGVFTPTNPFGRNIIGSASDGSSYWNVFNIEGESSQSAQFVTYASLVDMLLD